MALPAVGVLDMLRYNKLPPVPDGLMTMALQKILKRCLTILLITLLIMLLNLALHTRLRLLRPPTTMIV